MSSVLDEVMPKEAAKETKRTALLKAEMVSLVDENPALFQLALHDKEDGLPSSN